MGYRISDKAQDIIIKINIFAIFLVFVIMSVHLTKIAISEKTGEDKELYEIKTAPVIYVDGSKGNYDYCLVYDEDLEKITEVYIYNDIIYTTIEQGDIAVYVQQEGSDSLTLINVMKA